MLLVPVPAPPDARGRVPELWLIPPGKTPQPLGLLSSNRSHAIVVPPGLRAALEERLAARRLARAAGRRAPRCANRAHRRQRRHSALARLGAGPHPKAPRVLHFTAEFRLSAHPRAEMLRNDGRLVIFSKTPVEKRLGVRHETPRKNPAGARRSGAASAQLRFQPPRSPVHLRHAAGGWDRFLHVSQL